MKRVIQIRPLEPIISRDGRPFDTTPGVIAYSMPDFSPSMIAGTVRTVIGKQAARNEGIDPKELFDKSSHDAIKKLVVRGPIYAYDNTFFYPTPQDLYAYEESVKDDTNRGRLHVAFLSPTRELSGGFLGTGKNGLYEDILWPAAVPPFSKEINDKPAYIDEVLMVKWLSAHPGPDECREMEQYLAHWRDIRKKEEHSPRFLRPFAKDVRHHTEIETGRRIPQEQRLFTTEAISVPDRLTILAEVDWTSGESAWPGSISAIHSLGGKRRLAYFRQLENRQLPDCPSEIIEALNGKKYIRMVLVTPAYFSKGWKPGWLNEKLETNHSWRYPVQLRLRWANIPGWRPYSGWSYKENGEKAVRRMVPEGSVYYFEVMKGNPRQLAELLWLYSVSDDNRRKNAHDRDDGFGLALWGVWNPENKQR